jgi:hypothetical protein
MSGEQRSCFLHGDYSGRDACPTCDRRRDLAKRLGVMAYTTLHDKRMPQPLRDAYVVLLREAERFVLEGR